MTPPNPETPGDEDYMAPKDFFSTHRVVAALCAFCMEPVAGPNREGWPWPVCEREECINEAWRALHPEDGYAE